MRIWRSLDLIVTAAVALAVGVLGMLDLAGDEVVAGATLATLAVLAAGSLAARVQMRALVATNTELADLGRRLAEPPAADRLLTTSTAGVDVDLAGAIDIGIIGVTLNRTVRNHAARLRECVRRGGTVRVAVIDPDGAVIQEAARRSGMPGAVDIFAHRLQPTLDLLAGLAAAGGPGRVEVRLLDFVPAVGILAVDAGRAHGHLHVDIYSHSSGEREPVLTLHAARDQVWYQHFRDEFERIWASGRVLRREPA